MNHVLRHTKKMNQYLVSVCSISIVSGICLFTRDFLDYKVVGYLLLVVVSLLAIFLEIIPVLLAALLSAVILDFLFIKPYYTLHINSAEDGLLLLMFFVIALINAVLTFKIRKAEQKAQAKEMQWYTMKLYNTLLDSLSHELRTPISTIMGAVGTLQGKTSSLTEENQAKLLAEMEKASFRLNQQVENLLNMSRLDSGFIQPKPDWCDVSEIVYNVTANLSEELNTHKLVVNRPDYLPLFKLDYGLTEQILYNLIFNAAQYTPKLAEIKIDIEYKPEVDFEFHEGHPATCIIAVSDNGPGFPEAEIERAFDKFYRLKHSKTGGTGLGLSIVKGFAEAQDGSVTLENKLNGGAIFRVEFRAAAMHTKSIGNE
jgi:two-component system, OmpR family, sensor histidine kinase KdpD